MTERTFTWHNEPVKLRLLTDDEIVERGDLCVVDDDFDSLYLERSAVGQPAGSHGVFGRKFWRPV